MSPKSSSVNSLVDVAAPSDPMGSFLVEILHSVEGGDVEQRVLEPRNKSPVFAIALSISHLSLYLAYAYCLYLYMHDILCA